MRKIDKETAPATAPFLLEINVWSVKAQVAAKDATDGAYLGNRATWWVGRRKLFGGPMPDMIKVPELAELAVRPDWCSVAKGMNLISYARVITRHRTGTDRGCCEAAT